MPKQVFATRANKHSVESRDLNRVDDGRFHTAEHLGNKLTISRGCFCL